MDGETRIERHFRSSPNIGALAAALAKAQGELEGAKKDSANPFFKSKYADLSSVWDACRQQLSENGLALLQFPRGAEGGVEVETLLAHASGEWVAETLTLPVAKADAQGVGSAITYARRYALSSIVGIAPEEDDGNAAAASVAGMKAAAIGRLKAAAAKGLDALEAAWKSLSVDEKKACKLELDSLKAKAAEAVGAAS